MLITNKHASFHFSWKKMLVKYEKVSKYFAHDFSQNFLLLIMSLLKTETVKDSNILARI